MANIFDVFKRVLPRKTIYSADFNGLQEALEASFTSVGDALPPGVPGGTQGVGSTFYCLPPLVDNDAVTKKYFDDVLAVSVGALPSYVGNADKAMFVNTGGTGVEWRAANFIDTTGGTFSGDVLFDDTVRYKVAVTDESIDCSSGVYFTDTVSATTTYTFDTPPAGFYVFVLEVTNGGAYTTAFPASVDWPLGVAPNLTAAGVDVLVFCTDDSGTTWRGQRSQEDSK